ncbi:hypothetical protein CALVIDRAFT_337670 [Calocera viscosa TUFC12733]|uniref:Uncharacterized protein n=1 Tax=Calocera viscosa (strain TUFC12733) TaxID=1330018 RepID=A0A167HJM1_CALVF|nr:hypothetical protein CALVIDRAFT_337670 [Calocera viscosa TUFC12733]
MPSLSPHFILLPFASADSFFLISVCLLPCVQTSPDLSLRLSAPPQIGRHHTLRNALEIQVCIEHVTARHCYLTIGSDTMNAPMFCPTCDTRDTRDSPASTT